MWGLCNVGLCGRGEDGRGQGSFVEAKVLGRRVLQQVARTTATHTSTRGNLAIDCGVATMSCVKSAAHLPFVTSYAPEPEVRHKRETLTRQATGAAPLR